MCWHRQGAALPATGRILSAAALPALLASQTPRVSPATLWCHMLSWAAGPREGGPGCFGVGTQEAAHGSS